MQACIVFMALCMLLLLHTEEDVYCNYLLGTA